jgi:hypothetical protein
MDSTEQAEILVAVGQTIAKLCEVSEVVTDPEFKDMLHDTTLALLKYILPPENINNLKVFEGRKQ